MGFVNIAGHAEHVIVLQMHPSSAQDNAMIFDQVHALVPYALVHTHVKNVGVLTSMLWFRRNDCMCTVIVLCIEGE